MSPLYKTFSFWFFAAFVIVWILQAFPVTGIILMFLAASIWCGYLLMAFMVSLLIEALFKRMPRWLMIIPMFFFGHYYALYIESEVRVLEREEELQRINPETVYKFNPDEDSLVADDSANVVSRYKIPVAYKKDETYSQGFVSYRIITMDSCASIPRDSEARIHKAVLRYRDDSIKDGWSRWRTHAGLCTFGIPEIPAKNVTTVEVLEQKTGEGRVDIYEKVYQLRNENRLVGEYRTASVDRYYALPRLFIGCGLVSSKASWECASGFSKYSYNLKTNPSAVGQEITIDPIALLLGLEEYREEDYSNFVPFAEHTQVMARARGLADEVVDEAFNNLEKIFLDFDERVPRRMLHTLTRDPKRIDDNATKIVGYLKVLEDAIEPSRHPQGSKATTEPDHDTLDHQEIIELKEKKKLMFSLLPWLSDEVFQTHAEDIFQRFAKFDNAKDAIQLYIRLADAAETTEGLQQFYESQLIGERLRGVRPYLIVQALCRAGIASGFVRDFMKAEFDKEGLKPLGGLVSQSQDEWYYRALFLALIKLDERKFVSDRQVNHYLRKPSWFKKIMGDAADGQFGPNNCVLANGWSRDWTPPSLHSVLLKY